VLTRIDIENFRCIESACLEFDARATGIIGANASGKTSLLEAIYFLGHGRSFRSQLRDKLLRNGADHFRVVARLRPESPPKDAGLGSVPGEVRDAGTANRERAGGGDQDRLHSTSSPAPEYRSWSRREDAGGLDRAGDSDEPGWAEAAGVPGTLSQVEVRDRRFEAVHGRDTASGDVGVEATSDHDGLLIIGTGPMNIHGRVASEAGPGSWAGSGPEVPGTREFVAGIEYRQGTTRAHLAGRGVGGISEIAGVLPIQVIDPGIHRLIEEGSARRRRLMDWGVFHVKHEFLVLWRRYQRALLQRNAALRTAAPLDVVGAWDQELGTTGSAVDALRAAYVERLAPYFERIGARLIGGDVRFSYRRGWSADQDLAAALQVSRPRDLRLKATQVGPHRADLAFLVDGEPARDRVSRGQQKMLAAAFILSQLAMRVAERAPRACLMLDDPAAELDVDNLGKLLAVIADIPAQLIVTSVHPRGLRGLGVARMFHVEQGRFSAMV